MKTDSSLEILESRIAPAGLTAKVLSGVLTIVGDPSAGTVTINETGATFDVFDGGTNVGSFHGVASIDFTLIGGAGLTANFPGSGLPGTFKVIATGPTSLSIGNSSVIGGSVRFFGDNAGQGFGTGTGVSIGKNLVFNGGGGSDGFSLAAGTVISGSATLTSIENGTISTTGDIAIGGNLTFQNTTATLNPIIQTTGSENLTVGGALKYFGSPGNDSLFLKGVFSKTATFVDPAGSNGFTFGLGSTVHGSVVMITGNGNDGLNLQGGTIDGSVKLQLGGGNNGFSYGVGGSVSIGGSVIFAAGAGDDVWQGSGGGLTVGYNIDVTLGGGANVISAGVAVGGTSVHITTGSGADTIAIDGSATNAAVVISLGAGTDSLAGSLLRNVVSANFDGGPGLDHFFENTVNADPVIIRGFEDFS